MTKCKRKKIQRPTKILELQFVCCRCIFLHKRKFKPTVFKGYLYNDGNIKLKSLSQMRSGPRLNKISNFLRVREFLRRGSFQATQIHDAPCSTYLSFRLRVKYTYKIHGIPFFCTFLSIVHLQWWSSKRQKQKNVPTDTYQFICLYVELICLYVELICLYCELKQSIL